MTPPQVDVKGNFDCPPEDTTLTRKDRALWFAALGFPVFPLKPNSKDPFEAKKGDDPAMCGGVNLGTTDRVSIEFWFRRNPHINYGIATTGRVVLDIDPRKDPENWVAEYLGLGTLPRTLQIATPSGGIHLWFAGVDAGQAKLKDAKTIDVRSRGGYVVGPGSAWEGKEWRIHTYAPPAPCPPEIAARLSKPGDKDADHTTPLCELDTPAVLTWAEAFIAGTPGALQDHRNDTLFRLACTLKDRGVSCDTTLELLRDRWCPECDPPYTDEGEIEKSVVSAWNNGRDRPGCDSADLHFESLGADPDLAAWDRQRAGVPAGSLTEGSTDFTVAEIIAWRMGAIVKGILHPGEQGVLYADPGDGKSFIALDLGWHIAQGKPWHGFKVKRAPVLYIALEGVQGFRGRMKTAEAVHGEAPWFRRQKAPVSLIRDPETGNKGLATVLAAAEETKALCGEPVGLIIVDTLARAIAGDDDNTGKDMMAFIDHRAGVIASKTGAAVLTVAHTNKLGLLSGSFKLSAAVEVILKIERDGDNRTLIGEKVKDGDGVALFDFTLRRVNLAHDPDGDPVNSCVIDATPPKPPEAGAKDTPAQRPCVTHTRPLPTGSGKTWCPSPK
jgi:hypothetical protein